MADRTITTDLLTQRNTTATELDKTSRAAERTHGRMGKLGGVMKGAVVAGAVGAAAGLLGVGAVLVQGVKDAAAYQQLQQQTAAVLKSTGNAAGTSVKHVDAYAASLESLSGVDETLIVNSQNVLATFTNIRNTKAHQTFDLATKAALNLSVAMHEDLQSATVQVGKALNNPIKGMTALQRVGVTLDDQQKKLITTYVKHGQTAKAQGIILAELNKEFGGAAKAAGQGFAGSMARAKDAMSDAGRSLGAMLLPGLTKLANWVATKGVPALIEFAHWVGPKLKDAWARAEEGGKRVWAFLSGQLWPALQTGYKTIVPALHLVVKNLQAAWKSLSTTGLNFKAIMVSLWPVLKVVGAVIGGVIVGAIVAWSYEMRALGFVVKTLVVPAAKLMVNVWALSMKGVLVAVEAVASVMGHLPGKTGAVFRSIASGAKTAERAIDGIRNAVNKVPSSKTIRISVFTSNIVRSKSGSTAPGAHGATGGIVTQPTVALIGEAGPEAVVPLNRTPGSSPLNGGRYGGLHLYITINGAIDPKGTAQAVSDLFNKARSGGWRPPAGTFA